MRPSSHHLERQLPKALAVRAARRHQGCPQGAHGTSARHRLPSATENTVPCAQPQGSIAEYHQLLQHCKFCLAPYGYGYGMRLIEAVAFGCIPVIVQVGGSWAQGQGVALHVRKPAVVWGHA